MTCTLVVFTTLPRMIDRSNNIVFIVVTLTCRLVVFTTLPRMIDRSNDKLCKDHESSVYTKVIRLSLAQEYVAHTGSVFSTGALRCTRTNGLLTGQKHGTAHLCFFDLCFSRVCLHFLLVKLSNCVNVQIDML